MANNTHSEKLILATTQKTNQRRFWLNRLAGAPEKSHFPYDYQPGSGEDKFNTVKFKFPNKLYYRLIKISRSSDYALNVMLLAGLNLLLYKYTSSTDIIVAVPIYKQGTRKNGEFINTLLPLRNRFNTYMTFKELLIHLSQVIFDSTENQDYPVEILMEELNLSPGNDLPLFDILMILQNIHDRKLVSHIKVNIVFSFFRTDAGIEGIVEYNSMVYAPSTVDKFVSRLMIILDKALANVKIRLSGIDMLVPEEKKQLLYEFSAGEKEPIPGKVITGFFEKQVKKNPGNTALLFKDHRLSYHEFNEKANRLAWLLKAEGLKLGDIVALMVERSLAMMVGLFAIIKAGGVYLPIDPENPVERINYILADSRTAILLTPNRFPDKIRDIVVDKCIDPEKEIEPGKGGTGGNRLNKNINGPYPWRDPAYVIYTSGSTGSPKGVLIGHHSLVNRLNWMQKAYPLETRDVILQKTPIVFDVSIWELFWWSMPGAALCILEPGGEKGPGTITREIERNNVTTIHFVPSMLSVFLEYLALLPNAASRLAGLRRVFSSGEALTGHQVEIFNKLFQEKNNTRIINLYGPTEAAVDVSYFNCPTAEQVEKIPIGKPIDNIQLYVLDADMHPQPVGITGELYIAGMGLAKGYLNRPELTAEKFDRDLWDYRDYRDENHRSYMSYMTYIPKKLYKTGDLARWQPDGNIEFLGRIDHQVKIRGIRIELPEIEQWLCRHDDIKEAVVIKGKEKENQDSEELAAYIVPRAASFNAFDQQHYREYLSKKLPGYMIPTYILPLEKIPLTKNGKVDRKSLPGIQTGTKTRYTGPRSLLEKQLAAIWEQVLNIKKIGIDDHFLHLGGNSIKGIRITNKIYEKLGEIVHVVALFQTPTIRQLAEKIESYQHEMETETLTRIDTREIAQMRELIKPLAPMKGIKKSRYCSPVFLLSPPRSGTTLLRVILAGHPRLFAPQELELLSFNTLQERQKALAQNYLTEGAIRAIMEIRNCDAREAARMMTDYENRCLTSQQFYEIMHQWLEDRILVDKTPSYVYDLEILKRAEDYFDSPRYIHLVRNPYAVIYSFKEAKLDQIYQFRQTFPVRQLAELLWLISHQNILEFFKNIPVTRKYTVSFEELVKKPAAVVSGICRFLGIEFDPDILQVYDGKETRMTDGIHGESKMIGDVKFLSHSRIEGAAAHHWKTKHTRDFLGDAARKLAEYFGYSNQNLPSSYQQLNPAPRLEYYHLSNSQKRLWILNQLDKNQVAYNMSLAFILKGDLNIHSVTEIFQTLVKRHESLRTTYMLVDGAPKQRVHHRGSVDFKLEYTDLRAQENIEQKVKEMVYKNGRTVFDLEKGPLFKVIFLQKADEEYVSILVMHHIISDGWSLRLLFKEFLVLYHAYRRGQPDPLPPLRIQYKDYAQWLQSEKKRESLKKQEEYWLRQYRGKLPELKLPVDYQRKEIQDYEGGNVVFELGTNESAALEKIALEENTTLFTLLLAIYNVMFAKICNQEDIVIGTPTVGRSHPDLEKIIGIFINILLLRNFPTGEKTFSQFLEDVKMRTLNAFANQDYQLEDLVDQLALGAADRNPLLDVMFMFQDIQIESETPVAPGTPGFNLKPYEFNDRTAKFDLTPVVEKKGTGLYFIFNFRTSLFEMETIERFAGYFKTIVTAVIENKHIQLKDIRLQHELLEPAANKIEISEQDFAF